MREHYAKYIPLGLFCAFATKSMFFPLTWETSLGLLVLGAIASYYHTVIQYRKIQELEKTIHDFGSKMAENDKNIENLKNHISGLKLGQNMKNTIPQSPLAPRF